ncbi:hypothetical protein, partial [Agrobacterium tumefaciens]|uniref:hypothetical protein n=1 Tax=Agrobacterium tumefaciens TaxID=358 RepID=UPI001AEE669A
MPASQPLSSSLSSAISSLRQRYRKTIVPSCLRSETSCAKNARWYYWKTTGTDALISIDFYS